MNDKKNDMKHKLKDMCVLKEFEDIFSEEVPRLPPKRNIYFIVDMIPGAVLTSKAPYQMNIIEFIELKSQYKN